MNRSYLLFPPALVLVCAVPASADRPALAPAAPDWAAIVGPYPALGTPEALQEVGILAWLQRTRTSADVARAQSENTPSLGCFNQVLPVRTLGIGDFPLTTALLAAARVELLPIVHALQAEFGRLRPYVVYPNLDPALPKTFTVCYPSSHAVLGEVYARIIAQLDPANKDIILETGQTLGNDRVLGGVHWPSDVEAGQRLGRAFATYWISQPQNRLAIQQACGAEWHAAVTAR
jgi:membrane-associated phospholipid phosphatase